MFSGIRARLRPSSLRARLTFWYLLTLSGALVALAVAVYLSEARTLYLELDAKLQMQVHRFAGDHLSALLSLDVAASLADEDTPVLVRQVSGPVVFRSTGFPSLDWAGERTAASAAREDQPLVTALDRAGIPMRIATLIVARPGAQDLAVQTAASTAPVRQALGRYAVGMSLAILVVLLVASYGGAFIARRALAPVDEIVRRVQHIQAAHLHDRIEMRAGAQELDHLVRTLNELLEQVEGSVRAARRFAADASHELQTPIAAMRGAAEMCLRGERPSSEYRLLAGDLLAEIERLSSLVRDLRLLALADRGQILEPAEPVDLVDLTGECCEIAAALAEEKGVRVETHFCGKPVVSGSPRHLRRAVLNLVQNAVHYSPAGSRVIVAVAQPHGHAMVMVTDHGCGIAEQDLPHVFEPFYRADPARARETGGTGLGLAIVDQIVQRHHGQVKVESRLGRGSTFAMYLPGSFTAPGGPE